MTSHSGRRPPRSRSILDSPVLSAGLIVVVLAIVAAILFVPGLLGPAGPGSSGGPSSGTPPTPSPPVPAPTFVRPTPSPMPTFTTYVVRAGDTLNSIARTFRTTGRSIAWWNRGTYPSLDPESEAYDPNHLEVGWTLVLVPGTVVDDNSPPTPGPGPGSTPGSATPSATGGAVGTPVPGSPATVISHGPRTSASIALTFDMGGRLEPAVQIVQWLIDHGVHATLFPTGKSASDTSQGLAAMQLAATRRDLFDFANHSWDHPDFRDLNAAQIADQLNRTEAALVPIVGASTTPWFRPPFGGLDEEVRAGVGAAGWRWLVMWDVDTIDWRPDADGGPTAAGIVSKIAERAQNGSIVLMHLGGWHTLEALPGILADLASRGLEPVTLGEMLGG